MRIAATAVLFLALAVAGPLRAGQILKDVAVPSPALGRDLIVNVYLPDGADGDDRFPSLYLLHGFGAGRGEWLKGGRIAETLDAMIEAGDIAPVIAIMPSAGKSWYVNSARFGGPGDYEDAIAIDLVSWADATLPTRPEAAHRGIAGLSMGGHGALRLAFAHPETFSAVAALSPGIWKPGGLSDTFDQDSSADLERWYPKTTGQTFDLGEFHRQSPFALIGALAVMPEPPRIFLAVGDDDQWNLHDGTVEFYLDLRGIGLKPELRVGNGSHSWTFWRSVTPDALRFLDAAIRTE